MAGAARQMAQAQGPDGSGGQALEEEEEDLAGRGLSTTKLPTQGGWFSDTPPQLAHRFMGTETKQS